MCIHCKSLIEAIDSYIAKADDNLEDELSQSGRVLPKETVKAMNKIESGIAASLVLETNYFIKEIRKRKTVSEFIDVLEEIKEKDIYCDEIKTVVSEQLHSLIPNLVKKYVEAVDSEIKITAISQKAYDWIDNWSSELANIMKLNSHTEIENILKNGLDVGSDIASVTQAILDSGIRDEYYKARRVAVTEILTAHNVAKQEAAMQNPCIKEKMWRHTGSHKNEPRENHVQMDGQRVPVAEPFTLIGNDGSVYYPMFPADPELPPEERINCHCLSQDIVDEEILGMSLEERQRLQQQIIDEMDDEWKKELDERNRLRAGIEI